MLELLNSQPRLRFGPAPLEVWLRPVGGLAPPCLRFSSTLCRSWPDPVPALSCYPGPPGPQSHLCVASFGRPAAGVDAGVLGGLLDQMFDQLQTDSSVGPGNKDVPSEGERHVGGRGVAAVCEAAVPQQLLYAGVSPGWACPGTRLAGCSSFFFSVDAADPVVVWTTFTSVISALVLLSGGKAALTWLV